MAEKNKIALISWYLSYEEYLEVNNFSMTFDQFAIPIETSNLRLYVIRLSDNIVIPGNGGAKNTRTYNENEHLNKCVERLQEVDGYLKTRITKGQIHLYGKQIYGKNLTFHLNGNYEKK